MRKTFISIIAFQLDKLDWLGNYIQIIRYKVSSKLQDRYYIEKMLKNWLFNKVYNYIILSNCQINKFDLDKWIKSQKVERKNRKLGTK